MYVLAPPPILYVIKIFIPDIDILYRMLNNVNKQKQLINGHLDRFYLHVSNFLNYTIICSSGFQKYYEVWALRSYFLLLSEEHGLAVLRLVYEYSEISSLPSSSSHSSSPCFFLCNKKVSHKIKSIKAIKSVCQTMINYF